jgi:ABC-2 type transport system permease protein
MSLRGIYAIWWREMVVLFREKPRLISTIINPLFWLFIFGVGLGASVSVAGMSYQKFIFPGILVQTFLFSAIFYGAYLVWDRRIDLLKAILVSPLSRTSIFFGKVLGGVTIGLLEAAIILVFGFLLGVTYSVASILLTFAIVFVAAAGLVAVGLTIGSLMKSPEGFQLVISFAIFPLFFLSGALFPLENLPLLLSVFTRVDPVTYIVDLLRGILIGIQHFSTFENISALAIFAIAANIVGVQAFKRMRD